MGAVAGVVALLSAPAVVNPTAVAGRPAVDIVMKDAELTPTEATAGDDISVRSSHAGCASELGYESELVWAVFPHGDFVWGERLGWDPADALASGRARPQTSGGRFGAWEVTFPAPDISDAPPTSGEIGPGSPITSPVLQAYGPMPFTVDGHQLDFVAKCHRRWSDLGDVSLSPEVPELGGSAVITTDHPCPMPATQGGSVVVELWAAKGTVGDAIGVIDDLGPVPVADDGSWSLTFDVPDIPDHRFALAAWCVNVEGGRVMGYWFTAFDVREPGGEPSVTPPGFWDDAPVPAPTAAATPTAAPAQPVRRDPSYTG